MKLIYIWGVFMIDVQSTKTEIKTDDYSCMEGLIDHLIENGYSPIIRGMLNNMSDIMGLPQPDNSFINDFMIPQRPTYRMDISNISGDVFLKENNIYVLDPSEDELESSVFGYNSSSDNLNDFCKIIQDYLVDINADIEINWENRDLNAVRQSRRRPYIEIEKENVEYAFKEPSYNQADLEIVSCLKLDTVRNFVIKLSKLKKIIQKDSLRDIDENTLNNLLNSKLIKEEYLLKCRQDQHTICTIPSKNKLNDSSMQDLKCDCGRSLNEEDLQTIYSLSSRCKDLINSSHWMSIWITELLKENGANINNIKWGIEANGEEIDIMLEDFGLRVLFELKDREFGLGDSYAFGYRFDMFEGNLGVISTTDQVAKNAKTFFKEQKHRRDYPLNIEYHEGVEGIQTGLIDLIDSLRKSQARRLVLPLSRRTGINLWSFLEKWIEEKKVDV